MAELVKKYQQYDEYKDSGLAWLGYMPSHWVLRKSKYLFNRMQRPVRPEDGVITAFRDGQVTLRTNRRTDGFTQSIKEIGYQSVRIGDLLVHAMDGFAGAIGVSDSDGKCSPVCSVCVPVNPDQIYMPYYGYLVRQLAVTDFISSLAKGIRERSTEFRYSEFSALDLAVPTLEEQTQIANFLDHETAQIDTLIEKQQTLIQLLKEKRQAVISHAVTKGLNPDAPMKGSGVEWLGEVPEHWNVKRIKHYGKIVGGFAFKSNDFIDSGYPVLKISNVSHLQLNFDDESFLPSSFVERHLEYQVEENDLVFAMTRPIISGGIKVAKIPKLEAMPLVNQRVGFLKLQSELLADFILYSSLSSSFIAQFKNNMTITNQPNISGEGIESVALPMPPENELVEIVSFLNSSEIVFQNLSIKSEQQIELLKERRTALISAAVTGKIDVRGWRASE